MFFCRFVCAVEQRGWEACAVSIASGRNICQVGDAGRRRRCSGSSAATKPLCKNSHPQQPRQLVSLLHTTLITIFKYTTILIQNNISCITFDLYMFLSGLRRVSSATKRCVVAPKRRDKHRRVMQTWPELCTTALNTETGCCMMSPSQSTSSKSKEQYWGVLGCTLLIWAEGCVIS